MPEFSSYPSGSDEPLIIVWMEFNSHFPALQKHMVGHTHKHTTHGGALIFLREKERERAKINVE